MLHYHSSQKCCWRSKDHYMKYHLDSSNSLNSSLILQLRHALLYAKVVPMFREFHLCHQEERAIFQA